jgi:hypothetical protein
VFQQISVVANATKFKVNGNPVTSDVFNYLGKNYVPVRDIAEMCGKVVTWDGETNTGNINDKIAVTPSPTSASTPKPSPTPAPTSTPNNTTPFSFSDYTILDTMFYSYIVGEVTNNTSKTYDVGTVYALLYDSNNKLINQGRQADPQCLGQNHLFHGLCVRQPKASGCFHLTWVYGIDSPPENFRHIRTGIQGQRDQSGSKRRRSHIKSHELNQLRNSKINIKNLD